MQVLELRQRLLLLKHYNSGVFRCFERKMELQEMVPLGGHPPHPPGRGTSVRCEFSTGPILEISHTIARDATKSYGNETSQNWRFLQVLNKNGQFCEKYLAGPILEKNHSRARVATKTSITFIESNWMVLPGLHCFIYPGHFIKNTAQCTSLFKFFTSTHI